MSATEESVASRERITAGPLAGAIVAVAAVATVVGIVMAFTWRQAAYSLEFVPTALAYTVVGAIVATRRPRNPIGWLLLGFGVLMALLLPAQIFATHAEIMASAAAAHGSVHASTVANWTAWWTIVSINLVIVPLLIALLLFPSGTFASPRWRVATWFAAVACLVATAVGGLSSVNFSDKGNYPFLVDPVTLLPASHLVQGVYQMLQGTTILGMALAAASLASRFRRAGQVERRQILWVAWAVSVVAIGFVVTVVMNIEPVWAFIVGAPLIAVAIGLAVLRHRLYDIDRLMSRTTSYAIVSAIVLGTYALVVTVVLQLLPASSNLAVAAATLAAAAVTRPAVRRVQSIVDRRFDRTKYNGQVAVHEFGTRLESEVDSRAVINDLRSVVATTVQPSRIQIWVRDTR